MVNKKRKDNLSAVSGKVKQSGLHTPIIQAKLTIGEPGDKHERKADHIADQVMRMPESQTI